MKRNELYLETCTTREDYEKTSHIKISLESLITYCVYKYCNSNNIKLYFVYKLNNDEKISLRLSANSINYVNKEDIPWQVDACIYPVVLCEDTIITGMCAVSRHICQYRRSTRSPNESEDGLLGFRKSCLQAPNEVSIWTKFCEVDLIRCVNDLMSVGELTEVPKSLVRFENHLKKPVRIHNVYKVARDIKKENLKNNQSTNTSVSNKKDDKEDARTPKQRKWKSNIKKELSIDCSVKVENLNITHQFAEGPFFTLADLVLFPSFHLAIQSFGINIFESLLPLTYKWFSNITEIKEMGLLKNIFDDINVNKLVIKNRNLPDVEDVSLYKSDPKRHNPKKRLFTKPDDIENALSALKDGMELNANGFLFENGIDWNAVPDGANPAAGHLPDERVIRKSQQLENLALAVLSMVKEGDYIVDFCSGSGHLGILIAHLLPKCTIILLENKEQSLLRARERVHQMGLKNVYFFQCNLDFFIGKFDIGIALHACGIASDLVLDKCLKANAKFVLCPCCYGSLHATDRLVYPRSLRFSNLTIEQYLCIGHTADQTHKEHPLTVRGARCMAVIDSDRARLAEELGYKVTLSRLKPLSCTPKNNLLLGVPS